MNFAQSKRKQRGHGLTENIIIVAVIAVSAFALYHFFDQTIRSQIANMANEVTGKSTSVAITNAQAAAITAKEDGTNKRELDAYTEDKPRSASAP